MVQVTSNELGLQRQIGKIREEHKQWGLQIQWPDSSVTWIEWPFFCPSLAKQNLMVRVDESLYEAPNETQLTLGRGWLKKPFVLPALVSAPNKRAKT